MAARRLLDLFCGAGGAAMGYHRAGFDEIVGVDLSPQKRYPFRFIQGDALTVGRELALSGDFDAIHASPPCQAYSTLRGLPWLRDRVYWDSIPPTLAMLADVRIPWIVENVERAPLDGITLCGLMFGLGWDDGIPLYRHRRFASSVFMLAPAHPTHRYTYAAGRDRLADRGRVVAGKRPKLNNGRVIGGHQMGGERAGVALGIDWMTGKEAAQAIPPAYTEWLGAQLIAAL